jgi:arabinofuranan 3-O-arabinosyltransferase
VSTEAVRDNQCGRSELLALEDRLFTARHLRIAGTIVLIANVIVLAYYLAQSLVLPDGRYSCIDFGWMWLSGKFAAAGVPGAVFDYAKFAAAQIDFFGPQNCVLLHHFDYPPTLLLLTYPLGFLSFGTAFALWNLVLLVLYLLAVYVILPRGVAVLLALAPLSLLIDLKLGHNGLLTAALIGFTLACAEGHPARSGVALALLTFKPQFGLLFPIALLANRNWRGFAWAAVATLLLAAAAALFVGPDAWPAFLATLAGRSATLSPEPDVVLHLQSVYGLFQWLGFGAAVTWAAQLISGLAAAVLVARQWRKATPYPLQAALLCAAALLASPYVLAYDLCILTMAAACLAKDGLQRGFLAGERLGLVACWAGMAAVIPAAPFVCAALLFFILRRTTQLPAG